MEPKRVKSILAFDSFVGSEPDVTLQKYYDMLDVISSVKVVPEPMIEAICQMFFSSWTFKNNKELVQYFKVQLTGISTDQLLKSIIPFGKVIFRRQCFLDELPK